MCECVQVHVCAQIHTHVLKCWTGGVGGESREREVNPIPLKFSQAVRIPEKAVLLKLVCHILWAFVFQIIEH